jgi:hypothetical protein
VFEDGDVQRFGKLAANRAVTLPADPRAQHVQTGNPDAEWKFRPGIGQMRDPKAFTRQVFEPRLLPGPRSLAHVADERYADARRARRDMSLARIQWLVLQKLLPGWSSLLNANDYDAVSSVPIAIIQKS